MTTRRILPIYALTLLLAGRLFAQNTPPVNVTVTQGGNQQQVNGSGQASVVCANCSGSGVSQVDNSGFTPSTSVFVPLGGEVDDTGTAAATENSAGAARITPQRGIHTNLRNNAGTEVGTSGAPLRFDPTGSTTQPVSGTITANQGGTWTMQPGNTANTTAWLFAGGKTNNNAAPGATNIGALGFLANAAAPTYTEGNLVAGSVDLKGAQRVLIMDPAGAAATLASDYAQGSTTSGQFGPLVQGAVTTARPTYTTGQTAAVSLTVNGETRIATADPCTGPKTPLPVNISTATTTEITPSLAGASTYYYICALDLVTAAANNVALVDDNTDGCGSVTAGLAGGTTAPSGWNFAANGGIAKGNGTGTVYKAITANSVLCLVTSANTQLSGSLMVVAAP